MKTMRLCTPLTKHNLKINWLILLNEKRWAAASVRLPEEEVARRVEGQDSSHRLKREKKSCCLLASGDSQSLLHWCTEIQLDVSAHLSPTLYPYVVLIRAERVLLCQLLRCFSAVLRRCRRISLGHVCRSEKSREVSRSGRRFSSQETNLSSLLICNTIYTFQPFLMQATC